MYVVYFENFKSRASTILILLLVLCVVRNAVDVNRINRDCVDIEWIEV